MTRQGVFVILLMMFLSVPEWSLGQTSADAAYVEGRVKELPKKKPGKLDVTDERVLQFQWTGGDWTVPYNQVKTVYVSLSRRSALGEAFGLAGAAVGAAKKRKLLLSLNLTDDQGNNRNCVFFLPDASSPEFIQSLETKTGRKAVYESEEARKAIHEEK
jgi:hypothetical protein